MKNKKNKRQTNIIFNALFSPEDEIKKYTHLLGKYPKTKGFYEGRAFAYFANREYEKALADYTKAYEADHKNINYLYCRADCFKALNDWERAIKEYKKIIKINDKEANAYRGIADILDNQHQNYETDELYARALSIKNNVELYFTRAYQYISKGDYRKALSDLENALQLNPKEESVLALKNIALKKLMKKN